MRTMIAAAAALVTTATAGTALAQTTMAPQMTPAAPTVAGDELKCVVH
jgi:hypothetical protein